MSKKVGGQFLGYRILILVIQLQVIAWLTLSTSVYAQGLHWAQRMPDGGFAPVFALAVNDAGSVYRVGNFYDTEVFGNQILVSKYDSNGTVDWTRSLVGSGFQGYARSIAIDGSQNLYVAGTFSGTASFGANETDRITLASPGGQLLFLAKFDNGGSTIWVKLAYASLWGNVQAALDGAGNIYVSGPFRGGALFGAGESNETTFVDSGRVDSFVAKYQSDGTFAWVARVASGRDTSVKNLAVDGAGNSYVTGYVAGSTDFEPGMTFVAKYDAGGSLGWQRNLSATGVAVDGAGNSYVVSGRSLTKLNSAGISVWENPIDDYTASRVAVDAVNNVFVNGLAGTTMVVAKYSSDGRRVWITRANAPYLGGESGAAMVTDGSGNVLVIGAFTGSSAIFGVGEANQTLLTLGDHWINVFIAKFAGSDPLRESSKDFDNDGKSDVVIQRGDLLAILRSFDNGISVLPALGAIAVPADYDGDGITDAAGYDSSGVWNIAGSTGAGVTSLVFGGPGFVPVPADYDGDGKADIAVYKDGAWSYVASLDGFNRTFAFGGPGWTPLPADYDGDGKADFAVHLNGAWAIRRSSDGETTLTGHGGPTWEPVPGDYDGDGKTDIAVYLNGAWSIRRSSDNAIAVTGHGGLGWIPVPADYDGDGKTDIAVYHPVGAWSIIQSSTNTIRVVGHGGGPQDIPLN